MLRTARFLYGGCRPGGTVYYWIQGRSCVFSAITKNPSSINAAEDIVKAICTVEHCKPTGLLFFDLQTTRGYSSKKPRQFDFDQLSLEIKGDEIFCPGWTPIQCPPDVLTAFRDLLGDNPVQLNCPS